MAQRARYNFIGGLVEDAPLSSSATTLTSAALAALPVITSGTTYVPVSIDPYGLAGAPEVVWITAHTASATTATIARGKEGSTARIHQADTQWVIAPTTADAPRMDYKRRTSGDLTLNSGASSPIWTNVDTGLDITLYDMVAGMVVTATPSMFVGNDGTTLFLDAVTVVSGSPVNSFANAGAVTTSPPKYGVAGWRCDTTVYTVIGAPTDYTIVSGDIATDGSVTFRLRYATGTNNTKTLFAGTNYAAQWRVEYNGVMV